MTLYSKLVNRDFFAKPPEPKKMKFTLYEFDGVWRLVSFTEHTHEDVKFDHLHDTDRYYQHFKF